MCRLVARRRRRRRWAKNSQHDFQLRFRLSRASAGEDVIEASFKDLYPACVKSCDHLRVLFCSVLGLRSFVICFSESSLCWFFRVQGWKRIKSRRPSSSSRRNGLAE